MVGSRRLSTAVVHLRVDLKVVWTSLKFIELSPIWENWPLLTSISIGASRPEILPTWPTSLDKLPKCLQHLRFNFCNCLDVVFYKEDLNVLLPSLETLELVDTFTTTPLKRRFPLSLLPTGLRTLRLKRRGYSDYRTEDIATLPKTLETFDCDLYAHTRVNLDDSSDDEEEMAASAREVFFPCPSLTYLRVLSHQLTLSSLPPTMTHIEIVTAKIMDLPKPSPSTASASTDPQARPTSSFFSLKTLFPKLRHLDIYPQIAPLPLAFLQELPASLTYVSLGEWASDTPLVDVMNTLKPYLVQFEYFELPEYQLCVRPLTSFMPNLKVLNTERDSSIPYPPSLTTLTDAAVSVTHLPSKLECLSCTDLTFAHQSLFKRPAPVIPFPPTLHTLIITKIKRALNVAIVHALPSTLTKLQVTVPDGDEVWQAISSRLTALTWLTAADDNDFGEYAGIPSTAALLPRSLTHLEMSGQHYSSDNQLLLTAAYEGWFRDGLVSLFSLRSLSIVSSSFHQDLLEYLPPQLQSLSLNSALGSGAVFAHLPRQLEALHVHAGLEELTAETAALLPRSLTLLNMSAEASQEDQHQAIVNALPPHLSSLFISKTIVRGYYNSRDALARESTLIKDGFEEDDFW